MMSVKDIYERMNIDKLINAAGHYTVIGGSRMSEETLAHIKEAAKSPVDIRKLQNVLHEKIATMTHNEAAYISNGAATGIYLSISACIALKVKRGFNYIPLEEIQKKEVLMFAAHRNPYDWVLSQLGVKVVQIGYPNTIYPLSKNDIHNSLSDETVAIFYVAGSEEGWVSRGALPFEDVVEVAKERNIPLIVDAAAQLPPVENLWHFTENGADVAVFSGGKDLSGPQSSGLVLGKTKILQIVQEIGFPNYGIGRMMKVGREEMVGLYSALEQYIAMDHVKRLEWCEMQISELSDRLKNSTLFLVERRFPNEAGQPIPRSFVRIINKDLLSAENLVEKLMEGNPKIYTVSEGEEGIYVNPVTLKEGELLEIIKKLNNIEKDVMKEV